MKYIMTKICILQYNSFCYGWKQYHWCEAGIAFSSDNLIWKDALCFYNEQLLPTASNIHSLTVWHLATTQPMCFEIRLTSATRFSPDMCLFCLCYSAFIVFLHDVQRQWCHQPRSSLPLILWSSLKRDGNPLILI